MGLTGVSAPDQSTGSGGFDDNESICQLFDTDVDGLKHLEV